MINHNASRIDEFRPLFLNSTVLVQIMFELLKVTQKLERH